MFGTERTRLAVASLLGLLCGIVLMAPAEPAGLAFPAAALLVVLLPGYTVCRAIFGSRLDPAEEITISIGLSLSLAVISGFVLNLLPSGLALPQWGALLGGISVVAGGIAWLRGSGSAAEEPEDTQAPAHPGPTHPAVEQGILLAAAPTPSTIGAADLPAAATRIPRAQLIMLGAAACILLASLGIARIGAASAPHEPFTQLWMVPAITGTSLDLGFTNDENTATTYRLLVTQDGRRIAEWTDVSLADGATWTQTLPLNFRRDTHRIRATLYRPGDIEPYRETHADVRFRPNAGQSPSPSDGALPPAATPGAASPGAATPETIISPDEAAPGVDSVVPVASSPVAP
jgi:hypothetical protein